MAGRSREKVLKPKHQSEPRSPSLPQAHPMPQWSSAHLDLVVFITAGPPAVMDAVRCQDRNAERAQMEPGKAEWNAYRQNSLSGLLGPFVRGMFTRKTSHPMTKESTVTGAGGGVCIIGWEAEHGRKRRCCPKKGSVKEKGSRCRQQEQYARQARMKRLIACCW